MIFKCVNYFNYFEFDVHVLMVGQTQLDFMSENKFVTLLLTMRIEPAKQVRAVLVKMAT